MTEDELIRMIQDGENEELLRRINRADELVRELRQRGGFGEYMSWDNMMTEIIVWKHTR